MRGAPNGGNKIEQTLFGVDALYLFSRSEIRPFVSIGLGAQRDKRTHVLGDRSGTSPYLSAGLGLQWMFTPNLGLQADFRRVEGYMRDSDAGASSAAATTTSASV